MYLIKNCKIVTEDGILEDQALVIKDGKIADIDESKILIDKFLYRENIEIIDGNNGYLTAGFIDIHSDYIENMIAPRPTSLISFELGLKEAEKVFLTSGITMVYHSLAIYNDEVECKAVRKWDNIAKLISIINDYKNKESLISNRIHARFEIDCLNELDKLVDLVSLGKVDLVSIMDHSPGQGQYRNLEIYKNIIKEYKNCSDDEANKIINNAKGKEKLALEGIKKLVETCRENEVIVASHDDDSIEKINLIKDLGIKISEFPITLEAALYAKNNKIYTLGGAPNILLGGSHSGNLSMAEGINAKAINALCSDYYPQGMLHSIFMLNEKYNIPLYEAIKLITLNPAKLLNINNHYGSIRKGKIADLLIIEKSAILPEIKKVFVSGKLKLSIN